MALRNAPLDVKRAVAHMVQELFILAEELGPEGDHVEYVYDIGVGGCIRLMDEAGVTDPVEGRKLILAECERIAALSARGEYTD